MPAKPPLLAGIEHVVGKVTVVPPAVAAAAQLKARQVVLAFGFQPEKTLNSLGFAERDFGLKADR